MGFRMDNGIVKTLWSRSQGSRGGLGPSNWPWGSEDTGMEVGTVNHSVVGTVTLLASGGLGHGLRGVKTYCLCYDNAMILFLLCWPQSATEDAAFGGGQGRYDRRSCEVPIRQMTPGCNPVSFP